MVTLKRTKKGEEKIIMHRTTLKESVFFLWKSKTRFLDIRKKLHKAAK